MSQKYTAEEVRAEADFLSTYSRKPSQMLTAYADIIERAQAGVTDEVVKRAYAAMDAVFRREYPAQLNEAEKSLALEGVRAALLAVWPVAAEPAQAVPKEKTEMDYEYDEEGLIDTYCTGHMDGWNDCRKAIPTASTSVPAESSQPTDSGQVPDGWVPVPREPTKAMLDAAMTREDDEPLTDWGKIIPASHAEIYKAMLAAAPSAPEGES